MYDDESNNKPHSVQSGHKIIDELKTIREALDKHPVPENTTEIPLLDEIITADASVIENTDIPLLAEVVLIPDAKMNELAAASWSLIDTSLRHWSSTLPEPVSSLSKKLLSGMKSQLCSNWEASFCKQSPEQMAQWEQWLSNTQITLNDEVKSESEIDLPERKNF